MKNLIISIGLLLFSLNMILAQRGVPQAPLVVNSNSGLINTNTKIEAKTVDYFVDYETAVAEYNNIDGSPYYAKESFMVDLMFNDSSYNENVKINIDLYNDEIIAEKGSQKKTMLLQSAYKEIIGKGDNEGLVMKRVNPKKLNKFCEVLFERDKFYFFVDEEIELYKNQAHVPGVTVKNKFIRKKKYHVLYRGKLYNVNLKKANIFDEIPLLRRVKLDKELKDLEIKKLKKVEDYVKLFNVII